MTKEAQILKQQFEMYFINKITDLFLKVSLGRDSGHFIDDKPSLVQKRATC